MDVTVWVDDWQMQCCGEPFRRGARVSWTLRAPDQESLSNLLGEEAAATIDAAEEHHGDVAEDTEPTSGTVKSIRAVHGRYAKASSESQTWHVVPRSGVLTELESADGWTANRGELRFVGYLVRLSTRREPAPGRPLVLSPEVR